MMTNERTADDSECGGDRCITSGASASTTAPGVRHAPDAGDAGLPEHGRAASLRVVGYLTDQFGPIYAGVTEIETQSLFQ
jgi:hypothetical protein